mgnify:CR=1 FL=1
MTDKPRMTALRLHKALYPIWRNDPGWKGVLTTVNNNTIGNMFILGATGMFLAGGILAMLIRAQLASPRSAFMGPEIYNQIFTMHGTIMMFLFAIPFFEALAIERNVMRLILMLLVLIAAAAGMASRDFRVREDTTWVRTGLVELSLRLQGDLRLELLGC